MKYILRIKSVSMVACLLFAGTIHAQFNLAGFNHIIGYGQSLSLGSVDTCIISGIQKYNSQMFSKELRSLDFASTDFATLTLAPLTEKVWVNHVNYAETPYSGMSEMLIESLVKDNKFNEMSQRFFFHAPGKGGTSINGLNKGTTTVKTYDYLVRGLIRAKQLATTEGLTYKVPCFTWIHGEQDLSTFMDPSTYSSLMKNLQKDIQDTVQSISGQTDRVPCVMSQTTSFNRYHILRSAANIDSFPNYKISVVQYQLALEEPTKFIWSTTMYPFIYGKDNVHLTAESSKLVGAYFGYAIKRGVIDGDTLRPIHPVKYTINGNELIVKFFVPSKPLVLDTKQVRFIDHFGFDLFRGNNRLEINSVELVSEDELRIVCNQPVSSGDILTYAINGYTTGALNGARGNLRDSQGESVQFTIDCTTHKLHNWCPIFKETIK